MYSLTIRATAMPGRAELLAVLDAAAWSNARWFLAQHEAGVEIPCCNDCDDGIRYMPDSPSTANTFRTGAELVAAGVASCGELAAREVGRIRAKALIDGADVRTAGDAAFVELEDQAASTARRVVLHAVVMKREPNGSYSRKDPSAEKKAKAARG